MTWEINFTACSTPNQPLRKWFLVEFDRWCSCCARYSDSVSWIICARVQWIIHKGEQKNKFQSVIFTSKLWWLVWFAYNLRPMNCLWFFTQIVRLIFTNIISLDLVLLCSFVKDLCIPPAIYVMNEYRDELFSWSAHLDPLLCKSLNFMVHKCVWGWARDFHEFEYDLTVIY